MTFALLPQAKSVFLQPPFICGFFPCKTEMIVVLPQGITWVIQVGAYKAAPSPGKCVLPGGSVLLAARACEEQTRVGVRSPTTGF